MYDTANYFAILPAAVRYDGKLSHRSKLMYAALTSLAKGGYEAFAGNKFLSEASDTSEASVKRYIRELEAQKYITVSYEYKNGTKEIARRVIHINRVEKPLLAIAKAQALYAVIPSHILAMRELSPQAKLLYAEISAATPGDGFCSKQASFFAKLLNVSESSVRRWIKELQDADAVRVEMEYRSYTREIKRRRIYLTDCAEIAEKRAELGVEGSKEGASRIRPNEQNEPLNPDCGRNRGMLIFDPTSDLPDSLGNRGRKIRRKRKKAVQKLRL